MKPRTISIAAVVLASGLLFSISQIARVHADDRHERACSNKTLKGSYGFYRTGNTSVGMNPGPLAAVGILFFDGEGNWIVTQKIIRNGDITLPDSTFSGTYEVVEDCTGKEFLDTGVEFVRFVIVDRGKEFYFLSETSGNTVYGVAKKIHTRRNDDDR